MKIKMKNLRRLIRESISASHKAKLWELFWAGENDVANHVQAVGLADSLGYDAFPGVELFNTTEEGLADALEEMYWTDDWGDPGNGFKHVLKPLRNSVDQGEDYEFEFKGNEAIMYCLFVVHEDGEDYDFGMGETYPVVTQPSVDGIRDELEQIAWSCVEGTPWRRHIMAIDCEVGSTQAEIDDLQNGMAHITITFL